MRYVSLRPAQQPLRVRQRARVGAEIWNKTGARPNLNERTVARRTVYRRSTLHDAAVRRTILVISALPLLPHCSSLLRRFYRSHSCSPVEMAPPPPPPTACAAVAAMSVDKENLQQRPLQRRISMSTQQRQPLQPRNDNRTSLAANNTATAAGHGLKEKTRQPAHQAIQTLEEKSTAHL